MNPDVQNPFQTLQSNASELFGKILAKHAKNMACKDGCAQCCSAQFSIFSGEAALILQWFQLITKEQQNHLARFWQDQKSTSKPVCAFLSSGTCTIYEARPLICRTQGAPLCLSDEVKKTKSLTACDLNFKGGSEIPRTPEDWFDLNRLTELQSIAEQFFLRSGKLSQAIKALQDTEGRIPLHSLREYLVSLTR